MLHGGQHRGNALATGQTRNQRQPSPVKPDPKVTRLPPSLRYQIIAEFAGSATVSSHLESLRSAREDDDDDDDPDGGIPAVAA